MEIKTPPFLQINGVGEHGFGFASDFISKTEASSQMQPPLDPQQGRMQPWTDDESCAALPPESPNQIHHSFCPGHKHSRRTE